MELGTALVLNAVVAGLLLGGFYAAVSVGVSISFGMLDVVNIAHPAFIILGSYAAYIVNDRLGLDPILASLVLSPLFFLLGMAIYRVYYLCFERRGQESLRGLAFFFGILFITEVALILVFGVDYRMARAAYSETTWRLGPVDFPLRLAVPFLVSLAMVIGIEVFLTRTFFGRAVLAVPPDVPDAPTVTLRLDVETWWCLALGRRDGPAALAAGDVVVDGDIALGERIVDNLNFMI